jgi:hypothetical protein
MTAVGRQECPKSRVIRNSRLRQIGDRPPEPTGRLVDRVEQRLKTRVRKTAFAGTIDEIGKSSSSANAVWTRARAGVHETSCERITSTF